MKITIITATYNSGSTVRDTIESVLAQTYTDIEHIIVDGASKDDTMAIVKEYEPRYEGRLRYISEPDKGIYDAMNKGIAMATGDVIGILNSDDFYSSDIVLESIVKELNDNSIDAVYADVKYVDWNDTSKSVRYYSSKSFKRSLMRFGFMPAHPTWYCRKEVYQKFGGFDTSYRIAADFENLIRSIYKGGVKTKYIPRQFVTMREGGASSSGINSTIKIIKEQLRALKSNNTHSNIIFMGLKYIYKLAELMIFRITNKNIETCKR